MQQSSVIAAYLLIGFIIFIAVKGQLPAYMKVIGLQPVTGVTSGPILGMKF